MPLIFIWVTRILSHVQHLVVMVNKDVGVKVFVTKRKLEFGFLSQNSYNGEFLKHRKGIQNLTQKQKYGQ